MPPMDQFVDTAYNVTTQLFGPASGIPWWAWALVVGALMWKVLLPERRTAQDRGRHRGQKGLGLRAGLRAARLHQVEDRGGGSEVAIAQPGAEL